MIAGIGAVSSLLLLKLFLGSFLTDFFLRSFSPLGVVTDGLEVAQIVYSSIITAVVAMLVIKKKFSLPRWLRSS